MITFLQHGNNVEKLLIADIFSSPEAIFSDNGFYWGQQLLECFVVLSLRRESDPLTNAGKQIKYCGKFFINKCKFFVVQNAKF